MRGWRGKDGRVGVVRAGGLALIESGGRGRRGNLPRRIFANFFTPDFFGNALVIAMNR